MNHRVGLGMFIRNSSSYVLVSSVKCISACLSPQAAEAFAILRGMCVTVEADLLIAVLESDVKWVVDAIKDISPPCVIIIRDIVGVMIEFAISVSFISRKANKVAHALSKLALLVDRNFLWKKDFPPYINFVILEDSLP